MKLTRCKYRHALVHWYVIKYNDLEHCFTLLSDALMLQSTHLELKTALGDKPLFSSQLKIFEDYNALICSKEALDSTFPRSVEEDIELDDDSAFAKKCVEFSQFLRQRAPSPVRKSPQAVAKPIVLSQANPTSVNEQGAQRLEQNGLPTVYHSQFSTHVGESDNSVIGYYYPNLHFDQSPLLWFQFDKALARPVMATIITCNNNEYVRMWRKNFWQKLRADNDFISREVSSYDLTGMHQRFFLATHGCKNHKHLVVVRKEAIAKFSHIKVERVDADNRNYTLLTQAVTYQHVLKKALQSYDKKTTKTSDLVDLTVDSESSDEEAASALLQFSFMAKKQPNKSAFASKRRTKSTNSSNDKKRQRVDEGTSIMPKSAPSMKL